MSKQRLKANITQDLNELLNLQTISQDLHDKSLKVLADLSADDWKDIDNMSTAEASDMVRDLARLK